MKIYAVKEGFKTGLFDTWEKCEKAIKGYPNAKFKKFNSKEDALIFLGAIEPKDKDVDKDSPKDESFDLPNNNLYENYAYVDGSYNPETNVYGYGGFLSVNGKEYILQGSDNNEGMASMRNVAGEIQGAMAAVDKAIRFGLDKLTIYYDYKGIECWAKLTWKANNPYTRAYQDYMMSSSFILDIEFVHVKGHSGIEGNERADRLAKEAVGL